MDGERAESPGRSRGSGPDALRVLVVDDNPDVRDFLWLLLEEFGSAVLCADADEAMARLEAEPFDVVVMDLVLPGKSGADMLEWMRREGLHTPAVVVSGLSDGPMVGRVLRAGAVFVEKPFDNDALVERILGAAGRDGDGQAATHPGNPSAR